MSFVLYRPMSVLFKWSYDIIIMLIITASITFDDDNNDDGDGDDVCCVFVYLLITNIVGTQLKSLFEIIN